MDMFARKRTILILFAFMGNAFCSEAQDPHYTQFYSAPFTVNPAYAGVFEGDFRVLTNYRSQWNKTGAPYITSTVSLDGKIGKQELVNQHPLNAGVQFMTEKSMLGAFRSFFASGVLSYHLPLDEDGYQSIGAGLTGSYGRKKLDYSSLSFDAQYTGSGFDINLPSGEPGLQDLRSFISVGAGLLYQYRNPDNGSFFDLGVSAFHLNKPRQTFAQDPMQTIPIRVSAQASFQTYISETAFIHLKALYQHQATVSYLLGGFTLSRIFGEDEQNMIGAGIWYRSKDAVSPHLLLEFKRLQVGFSYDISMSSINKALKPASTYECMLQLRLGDRFVRN